MDYKKYCIGKDVSIREAMQAIDCSAPKIAFITDGNQLLASLTDGDVRRYLLKNGKLTDLAIEAANKKPKIVHSREAARELYKEGEYVAVPIVDERGKLTDLFVENHVKGDRVANLGIPVVINAGGKGTRLEPYTKILPKPLIPVGELPITEHIMQRFLEYGCDQFVMILNYKKELIKAYYADSEQKYNITYYDEEKPLETGGGLCYLKGKMHTTFFFTNCDNLLLSNYESMLKFHQENKNAITMIGAYKNVQIPYGVIEMGENGRIEAMREKPEFCYLVNTGIYIVEPHVLEYIENDVAIGFPDVIEKVRAKGEHVGVYPVSESEWLDMGQLSELEKMRIRIYGE